MTQIGDSLAAITGGVQPARGGEDEEVRIEVDQNAVQKALLVLRQLLAANLKTEYRFSLEDASLVWATQIGAFSSSVLNDAVQEWIADPDQEFPTVGDFVALCQYLVTERMRKSAEADARARKQTHCTECGVQDETDEHGNFIPGMTVRWVRVEDPGGGHHMRPCSQCLPERYDLYQRGHFDKEHTARGGCSECVEYNKPWLNKSKRKTRGSIG